jgi:trimeric autotransporter adhesin
MAAYWYLDDEDNAHDGSYDDDYTYGYAGKDKLHGNAGNDTLHGGDGDDTLYGDTGNDILYGDAGDDTLSGGAGNDLLDGGAGNDTFLSSEGNDTYKGGAGNDTYYIDSASTTIVELAGGGTDTVHSSLDYTLGNNVENLALKGDAIKGTGNALKNTLNGNAEDNILNGGAGDDTFDGGAGSDLMIGGAGNDTYYVDSQGFGQVSGSGDVYWQTDNNDNYHYGDIVSEYTWKYNATEGWYEPADMGGIDTIYSSVDYRMSGSGEDGDYYDVSFVENLILVEDTATLGVGNDRNNTITGNANNNILIGGGGADTLKGGEGNDTLVGGYGNYSSGSLSVSYGYYYDTAPDVLLGGSGDDAYHVTSTKEKVYETTTIGGTTDAGGVDTVISYLLNYTLSNYVENLTLSDDFYGDSNGTGNALQNHLTGNNWDNVLNGGAEDDTMVGGNGGDTYYVDSADDIITEVDTDWGVDKIVSSVSNDELHPLSDNVEDLTLAGTATIGYGNKLDNHIVGTVGNNTLYGLDGWDQLDGGKGIDTMYGGDGNDEYWVDSALDKANELFDEGYDAVYSSVSYTLGDFVESLLLTGSAANSGTGNEEDNFILGSTGNNKLYGLDGDDDLNGDKGSDTMFGGAGDDTYYVDSTGDKVYETTTAISGIDSKGYDTVKSSISYTLGAFVENLTLTGTALINGTGNSLDNVIRGNDVFNILDGLGGDDSLYGEGGNDILHGFSGHDTLYGGLGDDQYTLLTSGVTIVEEEGEGIDLVSSISSFTLPDNVENLELWASAPLGYGNDLDNILTGNGVSSLYGGKGDDTYVVTAKDGDQDEVIELNDQGIDTVKSSISFTLDDDDVENLVLTGAGIIDGTGNGLANLLVGNDKNNKLYGQAGDDILNGGKGSDTMYGGNGDDTYWVDATTDQVIEGAEAGSFDIVYSTATFSLAAGSEVEELILTGIAAINGTGNDLDNTISGNSRNNILSGGLGNDILTGGLGNDTLNGGDGGDDLQGGGGNDTLRGDVDNDTLDGGLGNDILTGGDGGDDFTFSTALSAATNKDTITDFVSGLDYITLDNSNSVFASLSNGALSSENFMLGTAAGDDNDFIIYNQTTGALFYDADGNTPGGVAAIQFASLGTDKPLAFTDISIIS